MDAETQALIKRLQKAPRVVASQFGTGSLVDSGDLDSLLARIQLVVNQPALAAKRLLVDRMCRAFAARYAVQAQQDGFSAANAWPGTLYMEAALDQLLGDLLSTKAVK